MPFAGFTHFPVRLHADHFASILEEQFRQQTRAAADIGNYPRRLKTALLVEQIEDARRVRRAVPAVGGGANGESDGGVGHHFR